MGKVTPIQLEVIANALQSVAEQMGVVLIKTAYSANIKERRDASVAIFDAAGRLLALAQHIPLHFSSLSSAVMEILKRWSTADIHDGDVFIANDPYSGGGSHLADIALVQPVFHQGRLLAFLANLGHHADRYHRGTTIYDEGLRIPAVKLYTKGKRVEDLYELILLNYQLKEERHGDFRAQMSCNAHGATKMLELCDKIGYETFRDVCEEWLRYGERKTKAAIRTLPDGRYSFTDYMDDDGYGNEDLTIKVTVTVEGEHLRVDFTGSNPAVDGPVNCVFSATQATVFYAVKALVDSTLPSNSGALDSVEIVAPPGSIVNATEPSATNDREGTTQRIADVIFGALAPVIPDRVTGANHGAICFFTFQGINQKTNQPYVYIETIGGGGGSRSTKDGLDAVQVHMTNSSNLPVEALEIEYPLRIDCYEMVQDSGGAGRFQGGMGLRRRVRVMSDSVKTVLVGSVYRFKRRPWGVFNGCPGASSRLSVIRDGEVVAEQPKIRIFPLDTGDVVELVTPGGGGYGDPRQRSRKKIEQDLRDERISKHYARKNYGV